MFQVGERVGDYEILQVLGAGGMGQVYKVRNTLSDRIEAMKVLLPGLVGDAQLADRFLREIKVQASLIHKNIAQLYTAQRNGDQILMLLEYVDGATMDNLMKRGALNTEAAVNLFAQVLDALAFAHAHGVVHRDIKPQNIMVTTDGTAKLMDFGIARAAQDKKLTQTGRTLGSLYYMSPEQIRGAEDIDGRSDLYSLGITLYEAATGTRPFEGDSDYTIMAAHLQQPPIPPVERDPRLNKTLSDVILAALEKDREQRFQSADAFKAALGHVKGGGAIGIPSREETLKTPPPPPPPRQQAPPPAPFMAAPPAVAPRPKSSAGMFMAIGALAFAALAGVGVWQYPRLVEKKAVVEESKSVNEGDGAKAVPQPEVKVAGPVTATKTGPSQVDKPQQDKPKPEKQVVEQARIPVDTTKPAPPPSPEPVVVPQQTTPLTAKPGVQEPAAEQPLSRELNETRQYYNQLATRLAGCKEGMAALEAQQQRMGLGLRGDVKDAARNAEARMHEASTALRARDNNTAKNNLEAAERMIDFVAKAVGR